ncbi:MAG TPA: tetratricopeptide repeat protein [Polaromonas sp.]|uniref:tetratricopeptide repeat protein n=1 Tax=Polaromonas sp. TaxID=1869339 RepID=UPI002D43CD53|nr:tetratricopeptide repeat protein [Polaromonas sp.]HYW56925.1 tetratricopeptide repeat protein [Polaromonas sp.]
MGFFERFQKSRAVSGLSAPIDEAAAKLEAEGLVQKGMALELQDRFDEALICYDEAIQLMPELARAHFNRGNILLDRGDAQLSLSAYLTTLKYKPDSAAAFYNLGNARVALGQPEAAIDNYRRAIALKPEFTDAHIRLASLQHMLGQLDDAAASYGHALSLDAGNADTHLSHGIALQELGRIEAAQESYCRALQIKPDFAEAHCNLGGIKKKLNDIEAAVACFQRAIEINPDFAEAHSNLGNTLQVFAKHDEAAKCFQKALELKPDFAEAHLSYGTVWQHFGELDLAEEKYRRAIELKPSLAKAHMNLGIVLNLSRRFDESLACYRRALEITPDYVDALVNLANVQKDMGQLDAALATLRRALALDGNCIQAHHNLLFIQNYLAEHPAKQISGDARRFGEVVTRQARPYTSWPNSPLPERRLKVGLVSGDLCSHPVGYFLEGVLKALASQAIERLEVIAYPNRVCDDATSQKLKACCAGWHSALGLSDEALSQRIRDDGIDILLDLSGHSANSRLPAFAWKPAPIQASWLGYFATTGVPAMDYLIADPWTLPPSEEVFFTEQVWRLPETRLCFTPPHVEINVGPLPALTKGSITFACFNNLSKMNDAVVNTWVRVLNAVPKSRLFIKSQLLAEPALSQHICELFTSQGIGLNRLILEDYGPREEYLAAYNHVDIALDPFPYPGGTTTAEALWMGVPVLTLAGEHFLSRQGVGLMANAGLPDWIAKDTDDYVARAASLASDLPGLAQLRAGLRQQVLASPVYDTKRFAGHFEAALRGMWTQWCSRNIGAPLQL